ncbi:MAG: protein kinase, partial [Planctomycetes bacterium]|nr:protein kinase [Planctomycetota bacterium]
ARERFQREARAAAQLHHPNIVPIIDIGAEHDVNYYAMQFIRGRSLHELQDDVRRLRAGGCAPSPHGPAVQDGRIDTSSMGGRHYWQSIARIGRQVCKALAYAHQQGVVHRDIKPSNLMLDEQGNVWVTDFGLAKTADDGLTVTGDVVGTLRFMSPERFRGQCDERADVFSVGATLYELLALHPAFHSPDRLALIQSIQRDEPKPLRETDPTIPVDLETIVCKALEKDPRRRYQTAAEMGDDLGRFLDREPIRARRTSALGRLLRWAARNRALAAAIAGLVTLLLITAVSSVIVAVDMRQLAREADDARLIAERQLYGSQLQSASEAIASGRVRLARQRLLATPPHMRGWEWRHLHSRLDRSVGTVFDQRLPIAGLQFTSTGDRALVRLLHGNGYRIQVLAADGASLADLTHEPGVANAALLGDHHAVTIGRELVRWDLREGEIVHREPSAVRFAAPLDERHYLVGTYSGLQRRRLSDDTIAQRIDRPAWWATIRPGRAMLVAGFDRELALFDPSTLEPLPGGVALPDRGSMLSGRLSADGRLLACTTASGSALLFAFVDDALQLRHELRGFLGSPTELAFSRDARHVMLGTTQGGIYAWDCASGELAHQFHDHDAAIIGLCVHPVTDHVVSCDSRGRHH